MRKLYILAFVVVIASLGLSSQAHAQYRGSIQFEKKKKEDKAAKPVPRVFSSKVKSVDQAEKLDQSLNALYVSLWNFAGTDFIYQRKLYDLLKFERFKLTRYPAEFEGVSAEALDNLNENYSKIQAEIVTADILYDEIQPGILEEDKEMLAELWEQEMETFKNHSDLYFKMQHRYLKTYATMVRFILKQGGTYYYDASSRSLRFYQNSTKQFFGKTYDRLRQISFEQRKHLRTRTPANVDITLVK